MLKKNLFFQTFTGLHLLKKLSVLSLLIMVTASCGKAVKNLEERAKIEAAKPTAPAITSVSPLYADATGGDTLTISGARLSTATSVVVGSACTIVTKSASQITCTLAAGSGGAEDVVITNEASETTTLSDGFTYMVAPTVTGVTPTGGLAAGGDTVTITGTNFYNPTGVTLGGVACTNVSMVDSTTITCDTPAVVASTVDIIVTNVDAQTGTGSSLFTYKNQATVSSITSTTPGDGTYKAGEDIDIIVTFSEAVTTTNSSLTMSTLGSASYLSGSGSTAIVYRYTPTITQETTDLDVTTINIGDAADAFSILVDGTIPGGNNLADNQAIIVDNSYASLSSIALSSPADGTYAAGQLFEIVVTFDEIVNTSTSTLTLDTGATATYFSGSGTTAITYRYTSAASENSTDLNVTAFTAGDALDAAGNNVSASLPSGSNLADNQAIVIDTTAPTISVIRSTSTGDGYYNLGDTVDIDVTFDEVVIASTPTLTLSTGATATYLSGSGTTVLVFRSTVGAAENSADLSVSSVTVGDLRDSVSNAASSTIPGGLNLVDTQNIVIDTTDATISSISSAKADGTYAIGEVIDIDVTFAEAVNTSTSALVLDTGATATYKSGTGTATVTYEYTVAATESSTDLTVSSFTLGDTTDLAGNTLTTTLPVAANLADNNAIVIDTIAPTITSITSSKADGNYTAGEVIEIDVLLSETVTASTTILMLDTGGVAYYLSGSGTNTLKFTHTVLASQNSADLTVSSMAVGNAVDDIGNPVDVTLPGAANLADSSDIVVDTTAPTITSISTVTADGTYTVGEVIDIVVTFAESVTTSTSSISLDSGGSATYLSGSPGTAITYRHTVAASQDSSDLTVSAFTVGDTVDAATNAASTTLPSAANLGDNKDIIIDTSVPTITDISSVEADGTYGLASTLDITVTYSEAVTTTTSALVLDSGGTASYLSGTGTSTVIYRYTIGAGEDSTDLTINSVTAGDAVDAATNALDTTLPTGANLSDNKALVVDTTAASITNITSTLADGSYKELDVVDIDVTFDEVVTTTTSSLTLDSTGTAAYLSGSGSTTITYRHTIGAGEDSADLTVNSVTAGDAVDAGSNPISTTLPGSANLADNKAIVTDTVAPLLTSITTVTADGTYGIGTIIDIDVAFDEAVTTSTSTLTMDTGGSAAYLSGSGTATVTYRYTVAAAETSVDLTVTTFNVGDTADIAGNAFAGTIGAGDNLADASAIVIDTVQPTITGISSTTPDGTYTTGGVIDIDVTFDEIVTTTNTTLTLDMGSTATYSGGSGSTTITYQYTVVADEESPDLNVASITAGDATDGDGNPIDTTLPSGANLADSKAIIVDSAGPESQNITSTLGNGTYGDTQVVDIVVTFDEIVNTTSSSLTMDTGGSASYLSGDGSTTITYQYTVAGGEDSTDLDVTAIVVGDGLDAAGNVMDSSVPPGANLSDNKDLVIDTTDPTISSIAASSPNATYVYGDNIDIVVTFDEAVTTSSMELTVDSGSTTAVYNAGSGTTTITFRYTVGTGDSSTDLNVTAITVGDAVDSAGNALDITLPTGANLADNSAIVVDSTPPTITSISPQGGATPGGTLVTITGTNFDLGLTTGDVQVGALNCTGVTVNSATELTCTTDDNSTDGFGNVVVTNPDSQVATLVGGFLFTPEVTISTISQSSGTVDGGDTITITGTNFDATIAVSIGGYACTGISLTGTTQLTCDTSAGAAGTYDVNLTQYYQTATLSSAFTYIDGPVLSWQVGSGTPNPTNPADWASPGANTTWTFTLENTGNSISTPITISISGTHAAYWVLGTDTCSTATLSSAATCTVQVTYLWDFVPSGGGPYSAVLEATASSGGTSTNDMAGSKP